MRGSIRRRGKHSWQIRYYIRGRDKPIEETVRGLKAKAEEVLTERLAAIGQGEHVDPSKQTVGDYLDAWMASKKGSPTTLDVYRIIITKHLKPELGQIPIQSLNYQHLESYYEAKRNPEAGKPLSEQTLKHHHALLRKALKDASKRDLVRKVATEFVGDDSKPSPEKANIQVVESSKNRTLIALFDDQFQNMVLLSLATGMRRGEICGLLWDEVFDDRIHVSRTLVRDGRTLILKPPKTKKSFRWLTLPTQAITALKAQRARQAEEKLKAGELYHDQGFVFATPLGEAINPSTYSHGFKDGVDGTEFEGLTVHGLRHSHASQLIKSGINIKTISERLGHSTIVITLDTYGHLHPEMDQEAADAIGKTLG